MWIGGVDEAGYGPSLGPLVSSLIALSVERAGVACRDDRPHPATAVGGEERESQRPQRRP